MKNLIYRILTSLVLIPLVVLAFTAKGILLIAMLAIFSLAACLESYAIVSPGHKISLFITIIFWLSLFSANFFNLQFALMLVLTPFILINIIILFSHSIKAFNFEKIAAIIFWSIYIICSFSGIYWLASSFTFNYGMAFILISCLATWCNDTTAYFGGRLYGCRPLFPAVSQKKTWEGFFFGSLGSFLVIPLIIIGSYYFPVFFEEINIIDILYIVIPSVILAPLGDLIESRFKRLYAVKDSSQILPGHGGILDRIDGLLLMIPWTCVYVFIIRPVI